MDPQCRLGINVGFICPSIIRFSEPLTNDVFKALLKDYYFDENIFPSSVKEILVPKAQQEITWNNSKLSHFDLRTNQCELKVQKIINLQNIANQLLDVFTNSENVVKSHIPAVNTPFRIEIPKGNKAIIAANESIPRLKRKRPVGAKEKNHRK